MIFRENVIETAILECLKELYSYVIPKITWDKFIDECKVYNNKYKAWENYNKAFKEKENKPEIWIQYECTFRDWENKSIEECIGPKPFEFYYLPKEIINDIVNSYVHTYRLDQQQELLDTIEILKNYCKEPIVDKYIDDWTDETGFHHPGYRSYDHPDNLKKELQKIFDNEILPDICKQYNKQYNLQTTGIESSVSKAYSQIFQNKFFEFLDMAGNFFNWNSELSTFNMSIYLGKCPNSNKEIVIENWKKYRNQDIEINDELIKKEYYGDNE